MECFPWVRFILFGPLLGLITYLFVVGGKLHTLERFWDRTLGPFLLAAIEKAFFLAIGSLGLFVAWHVLKWLARYVVTHRIVSKDEWRKLQRNFTAATERVEALAAVAR